MPPSPRPEYLVGANEKPDGTPLRSLLEQMPALLLITDRNLCVTSIWGAGALAANVRPGELFGRKVTDFLREASGSGEFAEVPTDLRRTPCRFEIRCWDRDFEIRVDRLRDQLGATTGFIYVGLDITERKKDEEQIRYQARHDALTGLANYREFLETLDQEVRRAERANGSFAVLLLDLDDLKHINDRFGHLAGNRGLRRLAEILKKQCRSTDLAARYGGDEFAVLLIDADPGMARQVALRVENALDKDREEPPLRVSIGTSIYPDDGRTAAELLEAADREMYKSKKAHNHGAFAR